MTALWNRATLIVLAGMALTACADMHPEYPTDQEAPAAPTPPPPPSVQTAPASDAGAPSAAPVAPVSSEALPPVNHAPGAAASSELPPVQAPQPEPSAPGYTPPPYAPPPRPHHERPPAPTYIETVKGEVRAAHDKSRTIYVDNGDTVNLLAERFLTTKDEVIKLNHLKKPYELEPGQPLKMPTPKAYVVESGDTLFSIGKRFNVSGDVLAELNNVDPKGRLRSGQEVALPAGMHDSGPLKHPAPGSAPPPEEPGPSYAPPRPQSYQPAPPVRGMTPSVAAPVETGPVLTDDQVAAAGRGRFIWPVHGDILSAFGPKPGGQANDGVNIAAPLGTVVTAAAAGDVVYSGNQVPGYGNLVLIKHADGWVTAYAYLSMTTVKIKDHLEQGDEVGEVGQTGGVDLPQLHFEIRYAPTPHDKAKPIDPTLVLPGQ